MKKIVVLLMLIASVLCLCSCKEDIIQRAKNAHLLAEDFQGDVELQFAKSEEMELGGNALYYAYCEGFLYCLMPDEGRLYGDKRYKIIKYNPENGTAAEIADVSLEENDNYALDSVISLHVAADDIVVHCLAMPQSEDMDSDVPGNFKPVKITYDINGNKKSVIPFEENEHLSIVRKCVIDKEGNSYILTEAESDWNVYLIKYDTTGKMLCVRQMKDFGDEVEQCNGRIVLYRYGMNKYELGYYDIENDTYEPSRFTDIYPNEKNGGIAGTYNSIVLIMGEEHLFSYNPASNELKALINMKENHIDSDSVSHVEQIGDDEVIIIYSSDGYNREIMYFDSRVRNGV